MHKKLSLLAVSFLWMSCQWLVVPVFADDWKLTMSATYETGKYGTDVTTETFYVPVKLKRYFEKADLFITIPYVWQRGSNLVSVIDGAVFKTKRAGAGPTPVSTHDGLGDIIIGGGFNLFRENPFDLSLVGKIKFPTADRDKNLGTGEYDETVGLEFGKEIFPQWTLCADAYYTFIGSPPGTDLKNRFAFDVGLTRVISPSLSGSVYYLESTPLLSDNPNMRDILAAVEYKLDKRFSVFAGGTIGLTNSSPDYGITAGASIRF